MGNYVYQFLNNDKEFLYIGKTIELNTRMVNHRNYKKWFGEVKYIKYAECKTKTDMDIYEIYYINKLNPKYNKMSLHKDEFSVRLEDLIFSNYDMNLIPERIEKTKKEKMRKSDLYIIDIIVGNNYLENEEILEFYNSHKELNTEWDLFLKDKQILYYNIACGFNECCYNPTDIYESRNVGIYFEPYSGGGIYHLSLDEFLNDLIQNNIVPLKYLNNIDAIEINRIIHEELGNECFLNFINVENQTT